MSERITHVVYKPFVFLLALRQRKPISMEGKPIRGRPYDPLIILKSLLRK
jgi:hypothetical protein